HSYGTAQVDVDFACHIRKSAAAIQLQVTHDPGVVDQNVERGKLCQHAFVKLFDSRRIAGIALEQVDAGSCPPDGIEPFLIPAGHDHGVVALNKLRGQLETNSAGPSRDQ